MAEIAPFRGIRYDETIAGPAQQLLAPPYDVISEDERRRLAALSPHNAVHLILPQPPENGLSDDSYAEAQRLFSAWQAEGALKRDAEPSIYRYNQLFTVDGRDFERRGLIASVRLSAFGEGVILPHERTLAGPKVDRLKLMRATQSHFSQIFGLYPDPARTLDQRLAVVEMSEPALQGKTADGVLHKLWPITDIQTIADAAHILSASKIYIADGHHRYETMLALRDELRAEHPDAGSEAPWEFATFFLCNMDDPGLIVLPTHRVVHSLPDLDLDKFIDQLKEWFSLTPVEAVRAQAALAEAPADRAAFILATGRQTLLVEQTAPLAELPGLPENPALRALDLTVLHNLILEHVLKVTIEQQAAQTNLSYIKDAAEALLVALSDAAQIVFLVRPTPAGAVRAVADSGDVMPQKSTFFYPKIASGMVINPLVV